MGASDRLKAPNEARARSGRSWPRPRSSALCSMQYGSVLQLRSSPEGRVRHVGVEGCAERKLCMVLDFSRHPSLRCSQHDARGVVVERTI